MIRYGLDFFEQYERSKMDYNVSQEVIDIINNLAQLVGAPSYVKTPNFKEKNHSRNKKHKTDWALIRNFKVTKGIFVSDPNGSMTFSFSIHLYQNLISSRKIRNVYLHH